MRRANMLLFLCFIGALAPNALAAQHALDHPGAEAPVVITPDQREFTNSCASCHGLDGKGAGFLIRVFRGIGPGDLTHLAEANGGKLPLESVFSLIDGQEEVDAHGPRKIPVWGNRYMNSALSDWGPDEINDLLVRNRIYELVHYIQAIHETRVNED